MTPYTDPPTREAERLEVLEYYRDGRIRNPDHDEAVIEELEHLGCLRRGVNPDLDETIGTTENGAVYLSLFGGMAGCRR